jgi:hypothetical protein
MTPKQAMEIVNATDFEGDMTTAISAGRTLARRAQKLEMALEAVRAHQEILGGGLAKQTGAWNIANKALICDELVAGEST